MAGSFNLNSAESSRGDLYKSVGFPMKPVATNHTTDFMLFMIRTDMF